MVRRRTLLSAIMPLSSSAHAAAKPRRLLVGDVAPYAYTATSGGVQGTAVEMLLSISQQFAMPVMPQVLPMARAFLEAGSGEVSLAMPVARVASREEQFNWLIPLAPVRLMFFARAATDVDISSLGAVASLRIGALRAPGLEELYRGAGITKLEFVSSNEVAIRMLMANRFDAILTADGAAAHLFRSIGLTRSDIRQGAVVAVTHLWLVGSKSMPDAEATAWREAGERFLTSPTGRVAMDRQSEICWSR